ncbi:MAG TPA: CHASE4 domain-containing protein [Vitreimonas sp.]|uniref:sensor histidine kinase n=1 Tax=Vitreimonas sp. TaxID=3069702 RepID=UPI002D6FA946|nr:CHASE4 domain-containing protein [Vitreimonas sp.]HYD87597.1 CHASE4 domain-containing protein [Vitreimonas sp.]
MSITAKTGAILLIVFTALLGGAWFILDQAVRPTFERQDVEAHTLDRARVEANIAAIADDLRTRAVDYARWDDTYTYIGGANPSYIEDNFTRDEWLSEYGVDLAIYFDDRGRTLWSKQWSPDGAVEAMLVIRARVLNAIRETSGQSVVGGALWTESMGPIVYAAARSTHTDGSGTPRGWVVFGRRVDTAALANQTQLQLQFVSRRQQTESLASGIQHSATDLSSLIPLRAPNGEAIGGVIARSERAVSALGAATIGVATLAAAFMIAAAMCTIWLLLRILVISRIQRIERHFKAQSKTITPLPRDRGADEIARLTDAYNEFARRLGEANQRAREAILEREAAAAANRMKSDFLANISYELRTPLNDVIGYADLIDEELSDRGDSTVRGDLARITGAARSMMTLLTELLDLSRIEADRLEIVAEAFDVEEVFLSAAAALGSSVRAHNVQFRVLPPPNLGQAFTDQNRLRQCIVNMLTHAVRRSAGKAVTLRAERLTSAGADALQFEVTDAGALLSAAQIEGLFEPFLREDDERLSGARLGLAVTRKLAALMGGSFEVSCCAERGCVYVLTIPAEFADQRTDIGVPAEARGLALSA